MLGVVLMHLYLISFNYFFQQLCLKYTYCFLMVSLISTPRVAKTLKGFKKNASNPKLEVTFRILFTFCPF